MKRKLIIPSKGKFFLGVAEAFGNYFDVDSNFIRAIIIALFVFFPIPITLIYILLWVMLPREERVEDNEVEDDKFTDIVNEDSVIITPIVDEVIIEDDEDVDIVDKVDEDVIGDSEVIVNEDVSAIDEDLSTEVEETGYQSTYEIKDEDNVDLKDIEIPSLDLDDK